MTLSLFMPTFWAFLLAVMSVFKLFSLHQRTTMFPSCGNADSSQRWMSPVTVVRCSYWYKGRTAPSHSCPATDRSLEERISERMVLNTELSTNKSLIMVRLYLCIHGFHIKFPLPLVFGLEQMVTHTVWMKNLQPCSSTYIKATQQLVKVFPKQRTINKCLIHWKHYLFSLANNIDFLFIIFTVNSTSFLACRYGRSNTLLLWNLKMEN